MTRLGGFVTVKPDDETGLFTVDDAFVHEVERQLRLPYHDWDLIDPQAVLACAIAVFLSRYEAKAQ